MDDPGGTRRGGSGRSADGGPVHALPLAAGSYVRGEDALRHATEVRWSRRTQSTGEDVVRNCRKKLFINPARGNDDSNRRSANNQTAGGEYRRPVCHGDLRL